MVTGVLLRLHEQLGRIVDLRLIWISFLGVLAALSALKAGIGDVAGIADLFVVMHMLLVLSFLVLKGGKFRGILIVALLLRFGLMLWDIYFSHIFTLPNSGDDALIFFAEAIDVSQDMTLWVKYLRTGYYSRLLGTVFYFTGPSRMLAQYINVLLGLSTIMMLQRILKAIKVNEFALKKAVLIAAFFPNSMIMSAILLREILPTFLSSVSIYCFVKWFSMRRLSQITASIVTLGIASMFHAGLIGILLGYGYAMVFYKHERKRYVFTPRSLTAIAALLVLAFFLFGMFRDTILTQFRNTKQLSDLFPRINTREGNAAYLTNLMVRNYAQVALYTPIRMIYFLFSPLPFEWRGAMDAITFVLDACFYIYVVYVFLAERKKLGVHGPLANTLLFGLLGALIIFANGTGNAGTAFRHRQKLIPLFIVLLGIVDHQKHRLREETRVQRNMVGFGDSLR